MGAPSKGGPTLPALPRNSSMILWLKLLTIGLPPCDRFYGSRVQMMISHGPESRDPRGSCATRFLHSVLPGRTPVGMTWETTSRMADGPVAPTRSGRGARPSEPLAPFGG